MRDRELVYFFSSAVTVYVIAIIVAGELFWLANRADDQERWFWCQAARSVTTTFDDVTTIAYLLFCAWLNLYAAGLYW